MTMAYRGRGSMRRMSALSMLLAVLAVIFSPMMASAQQPETPPPAAAPGFSMEEPTAAPETPAAPEAAAAGEEEAAATEEAADYSIMGMLKHAWETQNWVTLITFATMVIMLVGTIYIAATKAIDQIMLEGHSKKIAAFWDANTLDEGLEILGRNSAFRNIAEGAIAQANSAQAGLGARITRTDRMAHQVGIELERVNSRLQGGMAFLATVGAICPFVGLFGTVVGIVYALTEISRTGNAAITVVAGPVGEALNMTAIGLAVAVPAVIFYNLLGRRNKVIYDTARHFAFDVDKLMASSAKA
jgi:biopolymer transport protein ExbB